MCAKKSKKNNKKISSKEFSHLKKESVDSYNEVSFNVLESVSEKNNPNEDYQNRDFSQRAVISSDEMLKKNKVKKTKSKHAKAKKHNIKKPIIVCLCSVCVLGIVAGIWFFVNNMDFSFNQKDNSPIKIAISEIAQTDNTLVKLNVFLEDSIDENKIKESQLNKEEFEKTKIELNKLSDKLNDLSNTVDKKSEDYTNINYALQTIVARTKMLETGIKIYENAVKSVQEISLTDSFWNAMIKADNNLKEADNLVQSNDTENYKIALEKSTEAKDLLEKSRESLKSLKEKGTKYDFSSYEKFVGLRLESAEHSQKACQALIDEDVNTASSENLIYLEKSNAASNIALDINTTPVQTIRTDYYVNTQPLIDEFKSARKDAAELDKYLRDYLEK